MAPAVLLYALDPAAAWASPPRAVDHRTFRNGPVEQGIYSIRMVGREQD